MNENNDPLQSPTSSILPEEGIVVHPEVETPKEETLSVDNVTNEAIVPQSSPSFEPTTDMLKFRDTLIRTEAMRQGLHEVCRQSGLHEDTYNKWVLRYGDNFKKWISYQWGMRKQSGLFQLLSVGLEKASTDYNYWRDMVKLFSEDDSISPGAIGNLETVQRITAQYTLEKKKEENA